MRIDIICSTCRSDLSGSFNLARDELEIEMCEDCLEKATDEAYDKGVEEGKEV